MRVCILSWQSSICHHDMNMPSAKAEHSEYSVQTLFFAVVSIQSLAVIGRDRPRSWESMIISLQKPHTAEGSQGCGAELAATAGWLIACANVQRANIDGQLFLNINAQHISTLILIPSSDRIAVLLSVMVQTSAVSGFQCVGPLWGMQNLLIREVLIKEF